MDGLLVIGLQHGAGEGSVAAAVAAVLRREGVTAGAHRVLAFGDGSADALEAFDEVGSPAVAAAQAGRAIDPGTLVSRLRAHGRDGAVIAAVPGGLLAPLTPRATVRDLAVELELAVVLTVRIGPDAANVLRLSTLAARAVRLRVAAIVLTGWPEEPDAVQRAERKLIGQGSGTGVLTLPDSPGARAEEVRGWPVADWIALRPEPAPAPAPAPRAAAPRRAAAAPSPQTPDPRPVAAAPSVALDPYEAWEAAAPTGDPRTTPRPRMMDELQAIIAVEGPIVTQRAFALYNRASGGKKLTTAARTPLSSAAHWLARESRIVLEGDVMRLPDHPPVRIRELGPRILEEVPLTEIAALMERLPRTDEAGRKRGILDAYGLTRLTARADEYLGRAAELVG